MADWFGTSWGELATVVSSTLGIYATVLVGLRVAGRRTVSEMSAFDIVVTIALGTLVASTALTPEPSYGRGLACFVTLLVAQQLVAVIRQRIPASQKLLDFPPEEIYRDGEFSFRNNPLTAQVTKTEITSRLRSAGVTSLDEVAVVMIEPDGKVSILRVDESPDLWGAPDERLRT